MMKIIIEKLKIETIKIKKMKIYIFILITLNTINLKANCIKSTYDTNTKLLTILSELKVIGQFYEIKIINNSDFDTFYFFNSYLKDSLENCKYFKRYDKTSNLYKISYLPFIYFLGIKRNDLIIFDEKKVIKKNQVLYSFIKILPRSSYTLYLRDFFLKSNLFYDDFNIYSQSKFKRIKFKSQKKIKNNNKILEFALYKNINFINDDSYYFDEFNFEKKSLDFKILKIKIPCNY